MRLIKKIIDDKKGNILIISAFAIPVLLAVAAASVDINRFMKARSYVQYAVDQAALAAASVDGQNRRNIAQRFFNAALAESTTENIDVGSLQIAADESSGVSVEVNASGNIGTILAGVIGINELQFNVSATAIREMQDVEAVLTLPVGGTVCTTKQRGGTSSITGDRLVQLERDTNCTTLNSTIAGIQDFITIMEGNVAVGDVSVGVVPYNVKVEFPNTNNVPASVARNEPERFYREMDFLTGSEPIPPILPLTRNLSSVRNYLNNSVENPLGGSVWSRTDLPLHVAGLMLDPTNARFFPNIQTPIDFDARRFTRGRAEKVVVLMTDGANIGCCFTNVDRDFRRQYIYNYNPYNEATLEMCDALRSEGVTIFTILFNIGLGEAGGRELQDVFARCATGPDQVRDNPGVQLTCDDKDFCFQARGNAARDVRDIYNQIARTFYKPRLL